MPMACQLQYHLLSAIAIYSIRMIFFEFMLKLAAVEKDIFLNDITYHNMGA